MCQISNLPLFFSLGEVVSFTKCPPLSLTQNVEIALDFLLKMPFFILPLDKILGYGGVICLFCRCPFRSRARCHALLGCSWQVIGKLSICLFYHCPCRSCARCYALLGGSPRGDPQAICLFCRYPFRSYERCHALLGGSPRGDRQAICLFYRCPCRNCESYRVLTSRFWRLCPSPCALLRRPR